MGILINLYCMYVFIASTYSVLKYMNIYVCVYNFHAKVATQLYKIILDIDIHFFLFVHICI